jgi:hypothetical protein
VLGTFIPTTPHNPKGLDGGAMLSGLGQCQVALKTLQMRAHDRRIDRLLCHSWLRKLEQRERDGSSRQYGEHGGEYIDPG